MNARQAALQALQRCRRDGAWAGASLDSMIRKAGLGEKDAALAASLIEKTSELAEAL